MPFRHSYLAVLTTVPLLLSSNTLVASSGTQAPTIRVYVSHTGEDSLGKSFARTVQASLRHALTLSLTEDIDESDAVLAISTAVPTQRQEGRTAAGWSLVVLREVKVYVGSGLRITDAERLQSTAEELVRHVESLLVVRRGELPASSDRLRYITGWNEEVARVAETIPVDACGIKARTLFQDELSAYLRLSIVANLRLDVHDVVNSVLENLTTDKEFSDKLLQQSSMLERCQADLSRLQRVPTRGTVKK